MKDSRLLCCFVSLLTVLLLINLISHFILNQTDVDGKIRSALVTANAPSRARKNSRRNSSSLTDAMMPLWWLAPFFDHTSFGKEAATIILGLVRSDGRETSDQVMLETTQGECNYSLDESMPYPDYLELDQAVKRGREHLLQWNKRHDVNATKNEGEAKVKYAKMIASASEAGRQPMKQFQMITDAIRSSMESQLGGKFAKIEVKAEPPPASSSDSEGPLRIRDRTYYSDEERSEGAIVVCHSLPPFWARPLHQWRTCAPCPPIGYIPAYAIGRAMAETDVYNSEFVRSCNTMDEIWCVLIYIHPSPPALWLISNTLSGCLANSHWILSGPRGSQCP